MTSWLFTFLWPLVRELMANILASPELQHREKKGGLTKTVIALLFIALIAVGDMALDAHAELRKLQEQTKEQKVAAAPVSTSKEFDEDNVKLLFCQANNTELAKDVDDLRHELRSSEIKVAKLELSLESKKCDIPTEKKPDDKKDKRAADRLDRIRRDQRVNEEN